MPLFEGQQPLTSVLGTLMFLVLVPISPCPSVSIAESITLSESNCTTLTSVQNALALATNPITILEDQHIPRRLDIPDHVLSCAADNPKS